MIKYFKSYIVVILLVKNIYLKKDLEFVVIFHPQRICLCTISKIIGRVIRDIPEKFFFIHVLFISVD